MFDVLLFVEDKHTIPLYFRKTILNVIPTSLPKSSRDLVRIMRCGMWTIYGAALNAKPEAK